jgi:hypothetical protein
MIRGIRMSSLLSPTGREFRVDRVTERILHCSRTRTSDLHHILLDWRGTGDWTATWSGAGRTLRAESKGLEVR